MLLPGEVAIVALGVDALLEHRGRWTQGAQTRATSMPFWWRRAIRKILDGEAVDEPDVPDRPESIPTDAGHVDGAPTEVGEALSPLLMALSPLNDAMSSNGPTGPLARPLTATETMQRDLLWRTLAAPETVLSDASRGGLSYAQLAAMTAAYPNMLQAWRDILQAELARAKPVTPTARVRHFVALLLTGRPAAPPPAPAQTPEMAPGGPGSAKPAPAKADDSPSTEATSAQQTEAS